MPNTYLKTEKRVNLALAALYQQTDLADLVTRIDGGVFKGALGDAVWYELDGITKARDYEWRTRTAPIVMDEIFRTKLPVYLNTHTYSGNKFTDEEETLDLDSYARQILLPQVRAVRDKINAKIIPALNSASFAITDLDAAAADDPFERALEWSARLDDQGTPQDGRRLVLGSQAFAWLAKSEQIQKYDPSQATTLFRRATFGQIAGFDVIRTNKVAPTAIYAVHPSWAVLANVAPVVPDGVVWGARRNYGGYGLRVIRDYDPAFLSDRSVVSTFTGLTEVKDEYARYEDGDTIPTGFEVGDIVIDEEGRPTFTGNNIRGARGTFTPAAG